MDSIRNEISKMLPLNQNKQFLKGIEEEREEYKKTSKKDIKDINKQEERVQSMKSLNELSGLQNINKPGFHKVSNQLRVILENGNGSPKEDSRNIIFVNNRLRAQPSPTLHVEDDRLNLQLIT